MRYQQRWQQALERRAHGRPRRLGSSRWWGQRSRWRPERAATVRHDVRMGRAAGTQGADVDLVVGESATDPWLAAPWGLGGSAVDRETAAGRDGAR